MSKLETLFQSAREHLTDLEQLGDQYKAVCALTQPNIDPAALSGVGVALVLSNNTLVTLPHSADVANVVGPLAATARNEIGVRIGVCWTALAAVAQEAKAHCDAAVARLREVGAMPAQPPGIVQPNGAV